MKIAFTFRHLESSDSIKGYATDKFSKLQRYLQSPLDIEVTFSVERREHTVDVQLSSGSEHFRGKERSEDMYASIDMVVDKLRAQLNSAKGGHQSQRRRGSTPDEAVPADASADGGVE